MIMTTIMITPMAMQKRRGWIAPPIPGRMIMVTVMATAIPMTTAMPAIPMITPPT
jgi:hypothetical protein